MVLQKKAVKDIQLLISPSRLSQKAGREQALPDDSGVRSPDVSGDTALNSSELK